LKLALSSAVSASSRGPYRMTSRLVIDPSGAGLPPPGTSIFVPGPARATTSYAISPPAVSGIRSVGFSAAASTGGVIWISADCHG
jgi:hypothetical protein